ncbi:DedA family protein [Actinopolyspora mortivallis]|uniref:DedA family protein n=1 Tax=Actinopolyspora mortivallis TaxID=33906 RepID=UPI00035ED68F|nr:DedA family protein [Actinopolyspora mortivallis]
MSLFSDALDTLSALPAGLLLVVAGAMAFAESGLGVGMVLPGETMVLFSSAAADSRALLAGLLLVVTLTGSAGDHIGYLLGRRYGPALRFTSMVRRMGVQRWDQAMAALDRHGARAIFVTRLVPVVRTFAPAAAGVSGVRYNRFLPASLCAAALWSTVYVGTGALARASLERVESLLGRASWAALGALVLVGGAVYVIRRRRTADRGKSTTDQESPTAGEETADIPAEKDPS